MAKKNKKPAEEKAKKPVERFSLCGQKFNKGFDQMNHEAKCSQCQALRGMVRQGTLGTLLEKAKQEGLVAEVPPRTEKPAGEGKEKTPPPEGESDKSNLGEYALPGPGPERLMEVLKNQRFAKAYAEAICRSFMGARWAWMESTGLIAFLQMHQIPYPQAMAVAAEYFGQPPGGMGGMGPGMSFPGQMPGMGNPYMQNPMNPYGGNPYGGGMGGMGPFGPMGMFPWWLMPPFPPLGGYERPQPAPAPAPAPQGESVAAAALATLGTVVTEAFKSKDSGGGGGDAAIEQLVGRFEDRLEFQKSMQINWEKLTELLQGVKDAQNQQQAQALQTRITQLEARNPISEFKSWREVVAGTAQDMGYAPPGSQDIYGAISGGIKDVNQTIQTGINALAGRGQKDKSLEERRAKAEQVLQEEKMLGKAMNVIRRAQEQRQAQAAQPEPAQPPLGRMGPAATPAPPPAPASPPAVPEEAAA